MSSTKTMTIHTTKDVLPVNAEQYSLTAVNVSKFQRQLTLLGLLGVKVSSLFGLGDHGIFPNCLPKAISL
jgi:hypothetical protein